VAANALNCRIVLADISEPALAVCRANMLKSNLSSRITAIKADVLKTPPAVIGSFDVIVSNPPYISADDLTTLDKSVRDYEPEIALVAGEDALEYFYAIAENWSKLLKPGGNLALECGAGQAPDVRSILIKHGFKDIKVFKDTLGIERVLVGRI
jgi:release factor glutamine methyltransferase